VCGIDKIAVLVTDATTETSAAAALADRGVRVITA
jgi:hypothetical protein